MLTATGSPGTSPIGYLGIHGIADGPDNGRGMRDMFIANNGCTGEENPEPGSGSLSHVKSEYICDGPPVSWITFVSPVASTNTVCLLNSDAGRWPYHCSPRRWPRRQRVADFRLS